MRVVHVITDLKIGGAQNVLLELLRRTKHESAVVTLLPDVPLGERVTELGVPLHVLDVRRSPLALRRVLRDTKPDVVQSWLYHADFLAGLLAPRAAPLLWNLRGSRRREGVRLATRAVIRACALMSRFVPRTIVCGSEAAAAAHAALGYDQRKMLVIPNGVDTQRFRRDPGRADGTIRIGLVARFDPLKDHRNFIAAAGELHRTHPDVRFVLAGDGMSETNTELLAWIGEAGLRDAVDLLGPRRDIERVYTTFAINTLSSYSEGFPNIVAEAMACEVPNVVTDAGDAARIAGDTGIVVPPRDPHALAAGWWQLIEEGAGSRAARGAKARARVAEHYSLDAMVRAYDALYDRRGMRE